ncbi:MAG: VOC family protein [Bdellovibrionota bacterium]
MFSTESFATIRLSVESVADSKAWYEKFFSCGHIEEAENFASFKIAGASLDIVKADAKSPISKGGSVGYWLVSDIDNAIQHAISLGGKIYRGPLRVEEVNRVIVQIEDPFGNVIGLEGKFV